MVNFFKILNLFERDIVICKKGLIIMKKNHTNRRHFALVVAMTVVLALVGVTPMASVQAASPAETAGYTFTEVTGCWCTIAEAPVYSLPSTDSVPLGILPKDQTVNVTGMCDQNKWFRIDFNGVDGYVDKAYLAVGMQDKDLAQMRESFINHVVAGHLTWTDNNGNIIKDRASLEKILTLEAVAENYDYIKYYDDYADMLYERMSVKNGFDRHTAEEIWCWVNVEREQAGLPKLAWDEATYDYACQRAQAIIADFSHNGCIGAHGENIAYMATSQANAYQLHMLWKSSPGHYANFMDTDFTKGACAVYVYNGVAYAVENFMFY